MTGIGLYGIYTINGNKSIKNNQHTEVHQGSKMIIKGFSEIRQIQNGVELHCGCIIDFIVKEGGTTTIDKIDTYTSLYKLGPMTAEYYVNLLSKFCLPININGRVVEADVAKLTEILEQQKTELPFKHGKPWTDEDTIHMCELSNQGFSITQIAMKLHRTDTAIIQRMNNLRIGEKCMHLIEKSEAVRIFLKKRVSPNPK